MKRQTQTDEGEPNYRQDKVMQLIANRVLHKTDMSYEGIPESIRDKNPLSDTTDGNSQKEKSVLRDESTRVMFYTKLSKIRNV